MTIVRRPSFTAVERIRRALAEARPQPVLTPAERHHEAIVRGQMERNVTAWLTRRALRASHARRRKALEDPFARLWARRQKHRCGR